MMRSMKTSTETEHSSRRAPRAEFVRNLKEPTGTDCGRHMGTCLLRSGSAETSNAGGSAASELVRLQTYFLGEGHKQVGERRVAIRVVGHVVAMREITSGNQNWKVMSIVGACVSKVGTKHHHRLIQQCPVGFLDRSQFAQEISKGGELGLFDQSQFGDFVRVFAMMR